MNRIWKLSLVMVTIILVDQFTKGAIQSKFYLGESIPIIKGLFNFTYVRNPGAAFGFGANGGVYFRLILFKIVPVFACFWLLFLVWSERHKSLLLSTAYALIFAGAVGNLIDRFTLNYVVDFLDFYFGQKHFPAFNVADSSISIAAGLLIIDFINTFRQERSEKANLKNNETAANETAEKES